MTVETVTVPKSFWEKIEAFLFTRNDPIPKLEQDPAPLADPAPDKFEALAAERDQFKAELDQMKAEREKAESLAAIVSELQDPEKFGAMYVELRTAQEAAEMLAGMTPDQSEWVMRNYRAQIAQIKESNLTEPVGNEGAGDLESDPAVLFVKRAQALADEQKIDFIAAVRSLAASEPDLYSDYQNSTRPQRE